MLYRFSLNLDIAAPKITVPTTFRPDDLPETTILRDLGHLILRTEEIWDSYTSEVQDIYLNFNLVPNDVSAFLVDGDYHWNDTSKEVNVLPVIDKCGISLKLQQIQVESSLYPSTRMAVWVPSLRFHFSCVLSGTLSFHSLGPMFGLIIYLSIQSEDLSKLQMGIWYFQTNGAFLALPLPLFLAIGSSRGLARPDAAPKPPVPKAISDLRDAMVKGHLVNLPIPASSILQSPPV